MEQSHPIRELPTRQESLQIQFPVQPLPQSTLTCYLESIIRCSQ